MDQIRRRFPCFGQTIYSRLSVILFMTFFAAVTTMVTLWIDVSQAETTTLAGSSDSGHSDHESQGQPQQGAHEAANPPMNAERNMEQKAASGEATVDVIKLGPEMERMSEIRTAEVDYRTLIKEIQTVGEIIYDERRMKVVSAWIGGRIDKLYVDFTGVQVEAGAPLAEIYSPELVSTLYEYLLALDTRGKLWKGGSEEATHYANELVKSTRKRLRLWGITQNQLDEIERTRDVKTNMTIYAPIGGTVIHKKVLEGEYVKTGDELYTIADLSVVWAMADIYEYEIGLLALGQRVTFTTEAYPGREFEGSVAFIDPFIDTKTRSVKVRMNAPNPELKLKPGMFVQARLHAPVSGQKPTLSIPYSAVLDTGARKLVFVETGKGEFTPVEVKIGPRAGSYVGVLSGLEKGQQVAVSANYLLDSQTKLKTGASEGFGGALGGHGGH